jgi:hypothetical protein
MAPDPDLDMSVDIITQAAIQGWLCRGGGGGGDDPEQFVTRAKRDYFFGLGRDWD